MSLGMRVISRSQHSARLGVTLAASAARHILDVDDLSADELKSILDLAERDDLPSVLKGKGVALLFEKPSARTRQASEMAVVDLGGHPITIRGEEVGIPHRETAEDVARTLACYHRLIGARVFDHATLVGMVQALNGAGVGVPVVNLLSDVAHPCQTLADLLTIRQCLGGLAGATLAYVGDANNVCHSLVLGACMSGMRVRVASPAGYSLSAEDRLRVVGLGGQLEILTDPMAAVDGADAVYTDVWTSMGQESSAAARRVCFDGFKVDDRMMSGAAPDAIFLHCLPAHRGEEVSASVLDGPQSAVWQQAANRRSTTRALFYWLIAGART